MTPVEHLAQYRIALPADYDMDTIRTRVRTRGSALDDREGLALKVYAVRERDVDGSPVNEYAPFYLWRTAAAMAGFHWGSAGFEGIVRDFGRPAVHTWVPVAVAAGRANRGAVRFLTVRTRAIPESEDLVPTAADLTRRVADAASRVTVHWSGSGIDPDGWEVVEFATLTEAPPSPGDAVVYRVLHISEPGGAS